MLEQRKKPTDRYETVTRSIDLEVGIVHRADGEKIDEQISVHGDHPQSKGQKVNLEEI